MTCHSQIWTNAAILAPVRDSLAAGHADRLERVTDLPDYVYFNHSIHIAKGVGCASCHGRGREDGAHLQGATLTMGFCLDCHRNPGPRLRPRSAIYEPRGAARPTRRRRRALLARYHVADRNLTDCSICHR